MYIFIFTVGEVQADVAAVRALPNCFNSPPGVTTSTGETWKLRWEEFGTFLVRVSQPDQVHDYKEERQRVNVAKNQDFAPYVVAVGPSWTDIKQYLVIVSPNITYSFATIREALSITYEIYWVLFLPYSPDYKSCWMVIQRCIYQMCSKKFDNITSLPLKQLLKELNMEENGTE